MKFLKKLVEFFRKTKQVAETTRARIEKFVKQNKKQIRLLITIFEAIFPAQTGAKKMACLVTNVCYALGLQDEAIDVADYVEKECQKVYDEFKSSLN